VLHELPGAGRFDLSCKARNPKAGYPLTFSRRDCGIRGRLHCSQKRARRLRDKGICDSIGSHLPSSA
jgi:hypothetical protein